MLAAAAMTLTSLSVWSVTPRGGFAERVREAVSIDGLDLDLSAANANRWTFESGTTLKLTGRLGHPTLAADRDSETYLYLTANAPTGAVAVAPAPVNLAIVIDRSGSMSGKRLQNAKDAARGMVSRMRDGDVVSVVTYNTNSETIVAPTTVTASSRERVTAALDSITAAGDTCISCGLDAGMDNLRGRRGMVNRMLLLSDGEATAGIRNVDGFRRIALRARDMGCSISAVGVDVNYNERIMSALAQASNGRHYFVENAAGLQSVFDREIASLSNTVANGAELRIDLAPGVALSQVYDRTFRREGNTLVVPVGSFTAGEEKTVLVRVRVPRGAEGQRALADIRLQFEDLVTGQAGSCNGSLLARLSDDAREVSPLDPLVGARLGRSETAQALVEANRLFASGSTAQARDKLRKVRSRLETSQGTLSNAAPAPFKGAVNDDFDRQVAALDEAEAGFAEPPPPAFGGGSVPAQAARPGRIQVRRNASEATTLGL